MSEFTPPMWFYFRHIEGLGKNKEAKMDLTEPMRCELRVCLHASLIMLGFGFHNG